MVVEVAVCESFCVTVACTLLLALLLVITNVVPPPAQAPWGLIEMSALASAIAEIAHSRQSKPDATGTNHDLDTSLLLMDQFLTLPGFPTLDSLPFNHLVRIQTGPVI